MRDTLIIHHIQDQFHTSYGRIYGLTTEDVIERYRRHLARCSYRHVILNLFDEYNLGPEHDPIAEYVTEVHEYGWGWEREEWEHSPNDFCEGNGHSGAVLIEDYMRKLPKRDVWIAGCFKDECLLDLRTVLRHLHVRYRQIERLCL